MIHLPFADRAEAGVILADELARRKLAGSVSVLALPRGGVPVALEVAKRLKAELDVVIVRKLGVPWQPELAMGAIASGSFQTLDQELIRALGISRAEAVRPHWAQIPSRRSRSELVHRRAALRRKDAKPRRGPLTIPLT